jgi:hypothetical protein
MSPNPAEPGSSFNQKREQHWRSSRRSSATQLTDAIGCLLARSGSILGRTSRLLLVAALLLITAHRLPAPIQEVPENPTPALEQSAKPKPKRTTKPKVAADKAESSVSVPQRARTAAHTATPNQNRFDGTWIGTLNNLPFAGNVEFTLMVTGNGMSVIEKSANFGTNTFQVNCDSNTMSWVTGSSWTLTPNPDSQTALVTCNNPGFFGVGAFSLSTVFRKAAVTQTTVPVASQGRNTVPVAKSVPNKPGFVYNPFKPNSHILLDVRGKPSGTKLIEPGSGKTFVVP